jgi:hypothetical protein
MPSTASAAIRCLCTAMNWVMETVDIRGSVAGRSRPSNLYTPPSPRSAVDAVGDKLWAPAPRRATMSPLELVGQSASTLISPRARNAADETTMVMGGIHTSPPPCETLDEKSRIGEEPR